MGTTANRGLRYPEGTALGNTMHTQIKNLADDVDAKLFNTGWNNLILGNGWVAYGSGFAVPRYCRFQGLVHITGLIANPGAPAVSSVIATLPVNFRFLGGTRIYTPVGGNNASARIDIDSAGRLLYSAGNVSYFSLDAITPFIQEA